MDDIKKLAKIAGSKGKTLDETHQELRAIKSGLAKGQIYASWKEGNSEQSSSAAAATPATPSGGSSSSSSSTAPVINPIQYPGRGLDDRDSVLASVDGAWRAELGNRLDELASLSLRDQHAGNRWRSGTQLHHHLHDGDGGILFMYVEEANGSFTPHLLDIATRRGRGGTNDYRGMLLGKWW